MPVTFAQQGRVFRAGSARAHSRSDVHGTTSTLKLNVTAPSSRRADVSHLRNSMFGGHVAKVCSPDLCIMGSMGAKDVMCKAVDFRMSGVSGIGKSGPNDGFYLDSRLDQEGHGTVGGDRPLESISIGDIAIDTVMSRCLKSLELHDIVKENPTREGIMDLWASLRRLRTAMKRFNTFLDLPKGTRPKQISKACKTLKELREINMMALSFSKVLMDLEELADEDKDSDLTRVEEAALNEVTEIIMMKEAIHMRSAIATLEEGTIRDVLEKVLEYVADPAQPQAAVGEARLHAPDILVGRLQALLQHGGWEVDYDDVVFTELTTAPTTERREHPLMLRVSKIREMHDLREAMRDARYCLELLRPMYDARAEEYGGVLSTIEEQQAVLAELRDLEVLVERLGPWEDRVPRLLTAAKARHEVVWSIWQQARATMLDSKARTRMYEPLLNPTPEAPSLVTLPDVGGKTKKEAKKERKEAAAAAAAAAAAEEAVVEDAKAAEEEDTAEIDHLDAILESKRREAKALRKAAAKAEAKAAKAVARAALESAALADADQMEAAGGGSPLQSFDDSDGPISMDPLPTKETIQKAYDSLKNIPIKGPKKGK